MKERYRATNKELLNQAESALKERRSGDGGEREREREREREEKMCHSE